MKVASPALTTKTTHSVRDSRRKLAAAKESKHRRTGLQLGNSEADRDVHFDHLCDKVFASEEFQASSRTQCSRPNARLSVHKRQRPSHVYFRSVDGSRSIQERNAYREALAATSSHRGNICLPSELWLQSFGRYWRYRRRYDAWVRIASYETQTQLICRKYDSVGTSGSRKVDWETAFRK